MKINIYRFIFTALLPMCCSLAARADNEADAVTITQTANDDYSYLLEGEGVVFTFDADNVSVSVNGEDKDGFTLSETMPITIRPAHTFKITANQDSEHPTDYYSTFYTGESAYKLPDDKTTKAYIGTLEPSGKPNVDILKMTDIGNIIHKSEPVMLKVNPTETTETQIEITLMPSYNNNVANDANSLIGTDVETTLGADDYALSNGENGVSFYLWNGKTLSANTAYLTLTESSATTFIKFKFDEGTITDLQKSKVNNQPSTLYNLQGIKVDSYYKGIVIMNGKKYLAK